MIKSRGRVSVQTLAPPSVSHQDWFPLATEQLRLRSLSEMIIYFPSSDSTSSFYLTFHESPFAPPFYTSIRVKTLDQRAAWTDMEDNMGEFGGVRAVIVRLWGSVECDGGDADSECLLVWGVTFSGLLCVGSTITPKIVSNFNDNCLVFKLQQHYFVCNECLREPMRKERYLEVPHIMLESCRSSYDKSRLSNLTSKQRALKQIEMSNGHVKKEISARMEPGPSSQINANIAAVSTSLRQQIFSVRPKHPATKRTEINLAVKIENLKFRLGLLKQEKERLKMIVAIKRAEREKGLATDDDVNNSLMENYHSLAKDKERLESWCNSFQDSRDCNMRTGELLKSRRHQLIGQLGEIFPLLYTDTPQPTICHVMVPSSELMKDREDKDLGVGLGWVTHLTSMVASLLGVPLRYPVTSSGSCSMITNEVSEKLGEKERDFPLFAKGQERYRFDYGVYLLSQNICQLRWLSNSLPTADLKPLLANLSELVSTHQRSGSASSASPEHVPRHQLPAPPLLSSSLSSVGGHSPARRRQHQGDEKRKRKPSFFRTSDEVSDETENEEKLEIVSKNGDNFLKTKSTPSEEEASIHPNDSEPNTFCDFQTSDNDIIREPVKENYSSIEKDVVVGSSPQKNGETSETIHEVEEAMEAGTDLFWDSVADRTQALAVPNTFKRQLTRPH